MFLKKLIELIRSMVGSPGPKGDDGMFVIGKLTRLALGYVGENESRVISIDMSEWLEKWPGATIVVQVVRPDRYKYFAATEMENSVMSWEITAGDVLIKGKGFAQITAVDLETGKEYKSRVVGTIITESLEEFNALVLADTDPAQKWVNKVLEAAQLAQTAIDKMPSVGENGNWWVWDADAGSYADSGVQAEANNKLRNMVDGIAEGSVRGIFADPDEGETALGAYAFAAGRITEATGLAATAFGAKTKASGECSHAEGNRSYATGSASHAEGAMCDANGAGSHAEGMTTTANGECSHAEGKDSTANGYASHAEGCGLANGDCTHAEGAAEVLIPEGGTEDSVYAAHAEGEGAKAKARAAHAEGYYTIAAGAHQHVEGRYNIEDTEGKYAHIIGNGTGASESARSNAMTVDWDGNMVLAGGLTVNGGQKVLTRLVDGPANNSIRSVNAAEDGALFENGDVYTQGTGAFAVGLDAKAGALGAMAIGSGAEAYHTYDMALGDHCYAMGSGSLASGTFCRTTGKNAFARGMGAQAKGEISAALGKWTTANGLAQVAIGCNNVEDTGEKYLFVIGNGATTTDAADKKSNAHTLDWAGNAWYAGTVEGTGIILKSTTSGSSKRFLVTVDDSGTLKATEVTE